MAEDLQQERNRLANRVRVMLFDEPTSALDRPSRNHDRTARFDPKLPFTTPLADGQVGWEADILYGLSKWLFLRRRPPPRSRSPI
jgi:hypothetical protein